MAKDTVQLVYFFTLLFVVTVLTALVFLPYLSAILFAIVLAIVFAPIHKEVDVFIGKSRFWSALVSTALVLIVIIIPLAVFGVLLFQELSRVYMGISASSLNLGEVLRAAAEWIQGVSPVTGDYLLSQLDQFNPDQYIEQWLVWAFQATNAVFAHTFRLVIGGAVGVLALFYLFKDGDRAIAYLKEISPLAPGYEQTILEKIESAINSVIRGRILAGLVQGVLTGLALAAVGVPAPVLWGGAAAVLSVIPMLGPGLVISPAVIYLFVIGNVWGAAALLIWAIIAIYFIDDILSPILIEQGMKIHPFLILISILGGIGVFGPIGFVAGPVVLALFFALLELYPMVISKKRSRKRSA